MLNINLTAQAIDDVLAGSFPASDPPAWTPGMARLGPETATASPAAGTALDSTSDVRRSAVVDVSRPARSERTLAGALVSLCGAMALALLAPVVCLAIGAPLALAVRGMLDVAERLLGLAR